MHRLPRVLLNALTVLSLAVCLAVLVSCWKPLAVSWGDRRGPTYRYAALLHGYLVFRTQSDRSLQSGERLPQSTSSDWEVPGVRYETSRQVVPFGELRRGSVLILNRKELQIDSDWLVLIAAPLPILRLSIVVWRRRRAQRRSAAGCCAGCGYDLRATLDRCPECGTVVRAA